MIKPIQITNLSNTKKVSFKKNPNTIDFNQNKNRDLFASSNENIEKIIRTKANHLKSIIYKKPLSIKETLYLISQTKNEFIEYELFRKLHSLEKIKEMSIAVEDCKEIKDIKIKSLIGLGSFAIAFETEDGKILKITDKQHFPNNRKPADFDVPIYMSGKLKDSENFYYYLEEKLGQKHISQKELKQFTESIKAKGYALHDYLDIFTFDEYDNPNLPIKVEQFGKSSNGKIYLLDPGCAIEQEENILKRACKFPDFIFKLLKIRK